MDRRGAKRRGENNFRAEGTHCIHFAAFGKNGRLEFLASDASPEMKAALALLPTLK